MGQSAPYDARNPSAGKEMHCLLWNPKGHHNVPLAPILRQINPVHTLPTHFLKALNTIHQSIHITQMKKYHPIFIQITDVLFYTVLGTS
jgi:hypothetical protein